MNTNDKIQRLEKALEESEKRYRLVMSQGLICTHDLQGTLLSVSPGAAQVLGYANGEMEGRNLSEFLAPQVRHLLDGYLENLRKKEMDINIMRILTKKGEERMFLFRNSVYREPGSEPYVLGHAQDVTELKQAERALRESEEKFRQIVETTREWIWSIDLQGRHTYCNPAVANILGYAPEDMMGRDCFDYIHPEDRHWVGQMLYGLVATKGGWTGVVIRWRHKNGSYRYLESHAAPILNRAGDVTGFRGTDRDITEQHEAEEVIRKVHGELEHRVTERTALLIRANEDLRKSEDRYRILVESINDGILQVDHEDVIQFTNNRFCEISGYSREELLGQTGYKLFITEPYQEVIKQKNVLRRKLVSDRYVVQIRKKTGELIWVEINGGPVLDSRGEAIGSMAILTDVTERMRTMEALRLSEEGYRSIAKDLERRVKDRTRELSNANDHLRRQIFETEIAQQQFRTAEAKYRALVEQLPAITYISEAGEFGVWHYVSPQIESLLGFKPSEWMDDNTHWVRQLHPDDRKRIRLEEYESARTGEPLRSEYRLIARDGRILWFRDHATPVRDQTGSIVLMEGILLDITDRKLAEESMLKLQKAVETTQLGVTITDLERRILYTNPAEANMHGYPVAELIGKDSRIFSPPEFWKERAIEEIKEIRSWRRESINVRKNGTTFPVQLLSDVVTNVEGNPIAIVTTCEDITERRRTEQIMERFVAGVAHEVRNPLNAIQASAQALQMDVSEQSDHYMLLEVIRSQVDRLSQLMKELLELGRPLHTYRMQWEPLSRLCKSAVEIWKQTSKDSRDAVELLTPPSDQLEVFVDGARMQQVLLNLLDNAAQHSPEDSIITLRIRNVEDALTLCITDSGTGLPEENLQKAFDPFFTTRSGGTGLGLSLVKHIVEAHGGAVSLSNNQGFGGCTVEIQFPVSNRRMV